MNNNDEQTTQEKNDAVETSVKNSQDSQTQPDQEPDQTNHVDVLLNAITTVNEDLVNLKEQFDEHIASNKDKQKMFDEKQEMFDKKQEMFDKFYQEIETNKVDALFEAFHKPVIHNLIQLYDHFVEVEDQLKTICGTFETDDTQNLDVNDPFESLDKWFNWYNELTEKEQKKLSKLTDELLPILKQLKAVPKDKQPSSQEDLLQFQKNFKIVQLELVEVLYRMNVVPYDEHPEKEKPEKLDLKLHKSVDTKSTYKEEEDMHVAERRKIGFYWSKSDQEQKQVIRPEEVVIYRYQPSENAPNESTDDKLTNGPEETTGENDTSESEVHVDENQTNKKGDK